MILCATSVPLDAMQKRLKTCFSLDASIINEATDYSEKANCVVQKAFVAKDNVGRKSYDDRRWRTS